MGLTVFQKLEVSSRTFTQIFYGGFHISKVHNGGFSYEKKFQDKGVASRPESA